MLPPGDMDADEFRRAGHAVFGITVDRDGKNRFDLLEEIEKELNLIFGDLQSGIYILKLAQNSKVTSFKLVKK